ncbi:MAG: hypothetical protein MUO35_13195 [Anaerolineales bacterium]|nr:hypothetical protein [Anaerolineales bacterium]
MITRVTPRRLILLLSAFVVIGLLSGAAYAQEGSQGEPFEDPALPGWERTPNAIVADGVLRIQGEGYAIHSDADVAGGLILRLRFEGDGFLEVRYRISEAGMYILRLSPREVALVREAGGRQVTLASAPSDLVVGDWWLLEMSIAGGEQHVFVGPGVELHAVDDDPLPGAGLMLHVFGEAVAEFDDLTLAPAAGAPSADASPPPESVPTEEPREPGDLVWVRLGGPPGGLGYDIRYNFDDPNTWYVTDANAGVHISHDDGLTWEQSNTGINPVGGASGDGVPVFSLTVDPHDTQIIWIGTTSGQIYRSADGGQTWIEKDQGVIREHDVTIKFRGFTVDPRTSDIVYAMAELLLQREGIVGSNTGGVVYRTTDSGEHWTRIWDGAVPSSLARYLWIDPRDPDVLYVSTGIFDGSAVGEGDPLTDADPFGGLGVLKSTDGGQTWRILGKENGLNFLYIGSLYMHPNDPDVLLAAAGRLVPELAFQHMKQQGHSPLGIYRTTDGGETWQQVLEPEEAILVQAFSSVDICPSAPDIVYAGSEFAVYRSQDAGESWALMSGGMQGWGPVGVQAGWPIDMQCDPRDPDRVFANNYQGGNFLSEDGGRTWLNASTGYSGAQVIGVAVDPVDAARVYAAGRSGGWYSEDGGVTWVGVHNPGESVSAAGVECGSVAVDPGLGGHVILACLSGFLEWDVQESHWERRQTPPAIHPGISEIEFAPSDPRIVYATSASHNTMIHADVYEDGKGIVASHDGGTTWQAITGEQFRVAILTDVAVDPKDANVLYVASQNGLFKSTDGGASWTSPSTLLQDLPVRTVAVSPGDSNHLLAGVQYRGLFISEDGGVIWRQVTAGLEPNGIQRDIVFDPTTPDIVYVADITSGVYQSTDAGESWVRQTKGLTNRAVTSLSISSDGLHLYAGTSGGGVFRLDLSGQPPVAMSQPTPDATEPTVAPVPVTASTELATPAPTQAGRTSLRLYLGLGSAVLLVVLALLLARRRHA